MTTELPARAPLPAGERRARRRPRPSGVALAVFLCCSLLSAFTVYQLEQARLKLARERAAFIAADCAGKIRYSLQANLNIVYMLDTLVRLGRGNIPDFDAVAEDILDRHPSLRNLSLAPDGVVRRIAPLETNSAALGHDLLADPARNKEAELARNTGRATIAGPFELVQGGVGVAVRQPVFMPSPSGGERHFWGFVIATFRFPDMLEDAHLSNLEAMGYAWELWRVHPDSGQKQILASSGETPLEHPLEQHMALPNGTWTFGLAPLPGWHNAPQTALHVFVGLVLSVLLAALAGLLINLSNKKKAMERMSRTDALTGLPNRRDFLDKLQKAVRAAARQGERLAVCYLDLDGFKQINDTLGHAAGDELLVAFAGRLRVWLGAGGQAARLGGDEFVAAFCVRDREHCAQRLGELMDLAEKPYVMDFLELKVSASLGAAVAPDDSDEADVLLVLADKAMYRSKRSGKRRYLFWREDADE